MTSDAELARFFQIGRAAVGFWPDDEPIPKPRQWELRARRPDIFPPDAAHHQPAEGPPAEAGSAGLSDVA